MAVGGAGAASRGEAKLPMAEVEVEVEEGFGGLGGGGFLGVGGRVAIGGGGGKGAEEEEDRGESWGFIGIGMRAVQTVVEWTNYMGGALFGDFTNRGEKAFVDRRLFFLALENEHRGFEKDLRWRVLTGLVYCSTLFTRITLWLTVN